MLLVALVVVSACVDRTTRFTTAGALEAVVIDHTGIVAGVRVLTDAEAALTGSGFGPASANPNLDLLGLRVAWHASPCQTTPELSIRQDAAGRLAIAIEPGPGDDACEANAVPFGLEFALRRQFPASLTVVSWAPPAQPH